MKAGWVVVGVLALILFMFTCVWIGGVVATIMEIEMLRENNANTGAIAALVISALILLAGWSSLASFVEKQIDREKEIEILRAQNSSNQNISK